MHRKPVFFHHLIVLHLFHTNPWCDIEYHTQHIEGIKIFSKTKVCIIYFCFTGTCHICRGEATTVCQCHQTCRNGDVISSVTDPCPTCRQRPQCTICKRWLPSYCMKNTDICQVEKKSFMHLSLFTS